MSGNTVLRSSVSTDFGDSLFPGSDCFSRELNGLVGEVLHDCVQKGWPLTHDGLSLALRSAKPQFLQDEQEADWLERNRERWENELKPQIQTSLDDFFLRGGKEQIVIDVNQCFDRLAVLGVHVDGIEKVKSSLTLGNWQRRLSHWPVQGRELGVEFKVRRSLSVDLLSDVLMPFGFSHEQVLKFSGGLRVTAI